MSKVVSPLQPLRLLTTIYSIADQCDLFLVIEHVGLPRAVEALHSFMWPNLTRHPLSSISIPSLGTPSKEVEQDESYEEGLSLTDLPGGEVEDEGGTYEDALEQL